MNRLLVTLLLGVCCGYAVSGLIGSKQSVAVLGRLFCKGNFTTKHWLVELYDRDLGDSDDKMAEDVSRDHGSFYVEGYETEITSIDPEIRIRHECGGKIRCFKIDIPDEFICSGEHPNKIYEIGTLHLDKVPNNC